MGACTKDASFPERNERAKWRWVSCRKWYPGFFLKQNKTKVMTS